jgi:hypothetical protein
MSRLLFVLALVALLGACSTPQQRCEAGIDRDLGALDAQIAEAQGNIARGYALRPDRSRTVTFGACSGNNGRGSVGITICGERTVPVANRPVAIDLAAERARLGDLQRQRATRESAIAAALAQCAASSAPHTKLQ